MRIVTRTRLLDAATSAASWRRESRAELPWDRVRRTCRMVETRVPGLGNDDATLGAGGNVGRLPHFDSYNIRSGHRRTYNGAADVWIRSRIWRTATCNLPASQFNIARERRSLRSRHALCRGHGDFGVQGDLPGRAPLATLLQVIFDRCMLEIAVSRVPRCRYGASAWARNQLMTSRRPRAHLSASKWWSRFLGACWS